MAAPDETAADWQTAEISSVAVWASPEMICIVLEICEAVADCSSTAAAIAATTSSALRIRFLDPADAANRNARLFLDVAICSGDFRSGVFGLYREIFDFGCNNREAFTCVASTRGFDRRVQGKQVGLTGDVVDQLNDAANFLRRHLQSFNSGGRIFDFVDDRSHCRRRFRNTRGDFLNG